MIRPQAAAVALLALSAFLVSSCHYPSLSFGGVIGKSIDAAAVRSGQYAGMVTVCPGEPITIGWLCTDCESLSISPSPGDIALPASNPGTLTFTATKDAEYTATARSSHDNVSTVKFQVVVIDPDKEETIAFTLQQKSAVWPIFWDATLPSWAYSTQVRVYRNRFVQGFPVPVSTTNWTLISPDNLAAVNAPVWLDGPERPLPGYWRLGTDGLQGRENLPPTLSVEVGLKCIR